MPRRSMRLRERNDSETSEVKQPFPIIEKDKEEKNGFAFHRKETEITESSSATNLKGESWENASVSSTDEDVSDEELESDSDDIEAFADTFADSLINRLSKNSKENSSDVKAHSSRQKRKENDKLSSEIDVSDLNLEGYISVDTPSEGNRKIIDMYAGSQKDDPVMKYSVITPDFETKHEVPKELGTRAGKKQRRAIKNATSGKKWFDMKAPELTDEVKRDMKILQMRSILDPKRFYKKNDRKTIPKYFQIGKIMDNAVDFYSSRVPKKQRKATLADELIADANSKRYQKRKFNEIQAKRRAMGGYKYFRNRRKTKK
uniref:Deoxynucleotidyltransferase terminal-interacting protein 2 n=1 Tax=Phallusia mammillata TaxID=59560 RepID=A0A6F9DAP5_9ASCI|nr:deoxynucleotidyltransferase terminal-interacting protein 2 [Phallusia mammillata]